MLRKKLPGLKQVKKTGLPSGNAKKTAKKPMIIELGNMGYWGGLQARRTSMLAEKMPKWHFVGIDRNMSNMLADQKNAMQIATDFENGLKPWQNNSVSFINSEMALGHYNKKGIDCAKKQPNDPIRKEAKAYTARILKIAHQKLKKGGRLKMIVGKEVLNQTLEAFKESGFKGKKIRFWKITRRNASKSEWVKRYDKPIYKIVAEK